MSFLVFLSTFVAVLCTLFFSGSKILPYSMHFFFRSFSSLVPLHTFLDMIIVDFFFLVIFHHDFISLTIIFFFSILIIG